MKYIFPVLFLLGIATSGVNTLLAGHAEEFTKATHYLLWMCIFWYALDNEIGK
jgi:hypothetical protein